MHCTVGTHLRIKFVESANKVDKAIAQRDSASGERRFKELTARTQEAFNAWLESSDEWADHINFCDDCHDGGSMIWPAAPPVGDIAVAARTSVMS
jgi:hypothetical protein